MTICGVPGECGNLDRMKRPPKQPLPEEDRALAADSDAIVQIKVWLLGVSPMVWRRVLVPATLMLRELHGVIQVAMGWEGYHLYQFCLRARRFGSWELSASSPDVALAALGLRKGARFGYEYDLNIPWRHEIRVEAHLCRRSRTSSTQAAPGALAAVHLRIAGVRTVSWPAATTRCRWMPWRTLTPWSGFSAKSCWKTGRSCSLTRKRAGD
jgi:hypothetical protein